MSQFLTSLLQYLLSISSIWPILYETSCEISYEMMSKLLYYPTLCTLANNSELKEKKEYLNSTLVAAFWKTVPFLIKRTILVPLVPPDMEKQRPKWCPKGYCFTDNQTVPLGYCVLVPLIFLSVNIEDLTHVSLISWKWLEKRSKMILWQKIMP